MKYHEICWHPLSCTAREAPGRFDFVTVEDGSGHRHPWHGFVKSNETTVESYPIGSMYAIYGNIYHQYTPNVSIYTSTMDPMGIGNILETYSGNILETHHQGSQVPFFSSWCSALCIPGKPQMAGTAAYPVRTKILVKVDGQVLASGSSGQVKVRYAVVLERDASLLEAKSDFVYVCGSGCRVSSAWKKWHFSHSQYLAKYLAIQKNIRYKSIFKHSIIFHMNIFSVPFFLRRHNIPFVFGVRSSDGSWHVPWPSLLRSWGHNLKVLARRRTNNITVHICIYIYMDIIIWI